MAAAGPSAGQVLMGPGLGLTPGGSSLLQQEIARLNNLLDEKMRDCQRLVEERDDVARKNQERIQMLEQQVSTSPSLSSTCNS